AARDNADMSSVADLIDRHTRNIVESWLRLAEKAPSAQGVGRAEIESSVQAFLADLARLPRPAPTADGGDTHQRLVEKKDELEATIERLRAERELRDRFVSVLAHDLRGPLSAAKLGTQLLLQLDAPPDVAEVAARIERNIERTDRMIRDLLDANRVRAGERLALRIDYCDLVAITEEVVEELTALHGERFVILAPTAMPGHWSPEELRRTLWNLATNALKYGAPDPPITVTLTPEPEHATVTVHNAGEPIPPPLQVQLFRAFARSASAQASGPRGWGLGLTLVLGCVEAHGGTVDVESSPEQGTTFTIRIPWDARPHQAPDGGLPADPPTR
ncbi:MAG TPA: HAMP domain-containing sensor histidine kinase, partial [Kofleriaceae bacterium]|nr:HAMP domain-containing sensor histidine kinase [Kofleriaceae bacterium]